MGGRLIPDPHLQDRQYGKMPHYFPGGGGIGTAWIICCLGDHKESSTGIASEQVDRQERVSSAMELAANILRT